MHERAQPAEHVGVGVGHDAVAEVEDVARAAGRAREHVERRRLDPLPRPEEDGAVEVALHAAVVADRSQPQSSGIRQSSPITSPPASRICSSSVAVPVPKWIVGHVDRGEDARRVRLHELLVVRRRERADPRVEELDHVGAGAHLRPRRSARRRR